MIDCGLCPLGVTKAKDGRNDVVGSGVRGALGGESDSRDSNSVAELIHRSAPGRGGDSGAEAIRKLSAKWSLINLWL